VTSISTFKFPGGSEQLQTYILTTGRDCYYCLHKVKPPKGTSSTLEIETVHKSSPPTRIVLEGAILDAATKDLILMGFRGVHFVVWNESTQTELMAVDCGGGHRTWVYHSCMDASFLVWTRAGDLNVFSKTDSAYRALRVGGHGREVKTMAISPPVGSGGERNCTILATGSEDTSIRLFLLDEDPGSRPCGSFQSVRTLKPSNTGLQHLQWSNDGRWLFSSAGNEDFDAWRVRHIPGFCIGVVRVGHYPKSQEISDLRITYFEAVEVDVGEKNADAFLIFMGYSNSAVKVRLLKESAGGLTKATLIMQIFYFISNPSASSYTLLAQGRYSSNCITHIRYLPSESTAYLISTATDGRLAKWDLESALNGFSVSAGRAKQKPGSNLSLSPIPLAWETRHQIHQSSVKAVAFYTISQDATLIISGGDDNALSISILAIPSPAGVQPAVAFSTMSLPDAHASAINDIAILRSRVSHQAEARMLEVVAASSGNDQRLKIWSIQVDISDQDLKAGDARVLLKDDAYTPVADLNCMAAFATSRLAGTDEAEWRLVLGGVGVEMWSVKP
jgi:WD40 repeat protein